jgi:hypothetical protein
MLCSGFRGAALALVVGGVAASVGACGGKVVVDGEDSAGGSVVGSGGAGGFGGSANTATGSSVGGSSVGGSSVGGSSVGGSSVGGSSVGGGAGNASSSVASTGSGAGGGLPEECPDEYPTTAGPCAPDGLVCDYGGFCNFVECFDGMWAFPLCERRAVRSNRTAALPPPSRVEGEHLHDLVAGAAVAANGEGSAVGGERSGEVAKVHGRVLSEARLWPVGLKKSSVKVTSVPSNTMLPPRARGLALRAVGPKIKS